MSRQTCHYSLGREGPDEGLEPFRLVRSFGRLDGSRTTTQGGYSEVTAAAAADAFADDAMIAYCCVAQSDHLALVQDPFDSRGSLVVPRRSIVSNQSTMENISEINDTQLYGASKEARQKSCCPRGRQVYR
jgi:hypothetical protein